MQHSARSSQFQTLRKPSCIRLHPLSSGKRSNIEFRLVPCRRNPPSSTPPQIPSPPALPAYFPGKFSPRLPPPPPPLPSPSPPSSTSGNSRLPSPPSSTSASTHLPSPPSSTSGSQPPPRRPTQQPPASASGTSIPPPQPESPPLLPRFSRSLPVPSSTSNPRPPQRATTMALAFGTLQAGEAVRLECLSRTFDAEVSEVRAWTWAGASIAMAAVVTRGRVPRRELPPGERVTLHAADGSRWEGAIGGSLDSAASIILQHSPEIQLPVPEATGSQRGVPDQPRDFGVPLVLRADTQQVAVPFKTPDQPPAPPVRRRPRDAGVPVVVTQVPRPAAFQFVAPPRDKETTGNAWRHGKNFRNERKVKSVEKGKYG